MNSALQTQLRRRRLNEAWPEAKDAYARPNPNPYGNRAKKPSQAQAKVSPATSKKSDKPVQKPTVSPDEKKVAQQTGKNVGFWMLPVGDSYMKLALKDSYSIKNRTLKNAGQKTLKQIAGRAIDKNYSVGTSTEGKMLPVWSVLANVKVLGKHFNWLLKLIQGIGSEELTHPKEDGHREALESLQTRLFHKDWSFAIKAGNTVYFGSANDPVKVPYFSHFVLEMFGVEKQQPMNIGIDFSGVRQLVHVKADGTKGKATDVSKLKQLVRDQPRQKPSDDESQADPMAVQIIQHIDDLDAIDLDTLLKWVKDPENIAKLVPIAHKQKKLDQLKGLRGQIELRAVTANPDFDVEALERVFYQGMRLARKYMMGESAPKLSPLQEVTYRKLYDVTRRNGGYRIGGMRKITRRYANGTSGAVWVFDPSVPGRTENGTRFVVTRQPKVETTADGSAQISYNFKSRPDRSTTGMRQKGYVKFLAQKRNIRKKLKGALNGYGASQWDTDVWVFCTCPDFKFRWHKVLFDAGASHQPQGGGEAINSYPSKTNPSGKLSLCKHLVAAGAYVTMTKQDYDMIAKARNDLKKQGLKIAPGSTGSIVLDVDEEPSVEII